MKRAFVGFWAVVLTGALSGCLGDSSHGEVHGLVSLDGKVVETGTIQFAPKDGMAPTAGAEITNGRYTARVPVGTSVVRILASKAVGQRRMSPDPNSPVVYDWQSIVPPRYNEQSELTAEVRPGSQEANFELASK